MKRFFYLPLLLLVILFSTAFTGLDATYAAAAPVTGIEPYQNLFTEDLSGYDFSKSKDLLDTLTFGNKVVWPSKDKLPAGFDPANIIKYGMNPGLGINKLHAKGYTGKGVSVAYIDQPLLTSHVEYKGINLVYDIIRPETQGMETSMHGPAVLSILAGKNIGVAPGCNVYYWGHPAWLQDQRTHAEALRKLIALNKTLPDNRKVRIVGFSDCADPTEKYVEEFKKAIKEAEDSGVMVFDVTTLNILRLTIKPYKDKDNPANYEPSHSAGSMTDYSGWLGVPTSGRTTATGFPQMPDAYMYWTDGGLSWAVPYIAGTAALGLQADPTLDKATILKYLMDSAYSTKYGKVINPEGFVKMVEANRQKPITADYYMLLYNSSKVSDADLKAIKAYSGQLGSDKTAILMKDTAAFPDAPSLYQSLKAEYAKRKGKLLGIQIFGTSKDVPSFDIHFKIQMLSDVDDSGNYKSDHFYSNFKNDAALLKNDFSIYKTFHDKLAINFLPDWPVSRLPLTKGEIAAFIGKYADYVKETSKLSAIPLVNFSNPIFPSAVHNDDMGYFIKERLDKEFGILKSAQYRLYGNKQGNFPVTTEVLGDYTKDNIAAENGKGIADFFVNTHGQADNIDQAVFETSDPKSEKRISFLNNGNINTILSKNYYTMTLWTCLNAWDLGTDCLAHQMLAGGKCVNAMAATSLISNNGVNNKASIADMKKNNNYYFQYVFFNNLKKLNKDRSTSFYLAKRAYAEEILKNTNMLGDGNYQFNLHNVLAYHFLGLLEYPKEKNDALITALKNVDIAVSYDPNEGQDIKVYDSKAYSSVIFDTMVTINNIQASEDAKVNGIKAGKADGAVVFSVDCESAKTGSVAVFNPPLGDKYMKVRTNCLSSGEYTVQFNVPADVLKSVEGITINIVEDGKPNYFFLNSAQLSGLLG